MIERTRHAALFALYQATIVVGILLMPLALALERAGLSLPFHRVVESLNAAVEQTGASTA